MASRREFLQMLGGSNAVLLGCGQGMAIGSPSDLSRSLRVLILGGTGFIGPHFVHAAVERGHRVSVFNRGNSHADLPGNVERLVGDRNSNLESIRRRDWDAVIDLAAYVPAWVRTLGEALKDRLGHYTFISTSAVYNSSAITGGIDESTSVVILGGDSNPYSMRAPAGLSEYGALKALCEQEGERQFPSRTLVLRSGYIVGPGDLQGYLSYWPLRARRGGEILVAGSPSMAVQFIDVRDLARFALLMIERNVRGTYNTVGPATAMNLAQLVNVACGSTSGPPSLAWISSGWLAAQKRVEMWGKLLFWSYESSVAWTMRMSNEKALAAGLTIRPLGGTLSDTLDWYERQPAYVQAEFLSIRVRKARGNGFEKVTIPWAEYIKCEKKILDRWSVAVSRRIAQ